MLNSDQISRYAYLIEKFDSRTLAGFLDKYSDFLEVDLAAELNKLAPGIHPSSEILILGLPGNAPNQSTMTSGIPSLPTARIVLKQLKRSTRKARGHGSRLSDRPGLKNARDAKPSSSTTFHIVSIHRAGKRVNVNGAKYEAPRLTPRQLECIYWVARGKSDSDIADIMGIRPGTVAYHIGQVRERFQVRTRVQSAVLAAYCGLIAPDPL